MNSRIFALFIVLFPLAGAAAGQTPWSGIIASGRAIDWSQAGIPGGIPSRTNICATISPEGTLSAPVVPTDINRAIAACASGGGGVVALAAGTFYISDSISFGNVSNVTLRGAGANQTIIYSEITANDPAVSVGSWASSSSTGTVSITAGASAGSSSITVSSASGITAGEFFLVTQLNDYRVPISIQGNEGNCTWCGYYIGSSGTANQNGARAAGQIVQVTGVSGTTLTLSPALFRTYSTALPDWTASFSYPMESFINPSTQPTHYYEQTYNNGTSPYNCTSGTTEPTWPTNGTTVTDGTCVWKDDGLGTTTQPLASPLTMNASSDGIEALQVYATNSHTEPYAGGDYSNFYIVNCYECWVNGVEGNYTDGDHVELVQCFHCEIVNSYFNDAFLHHEGQYDSDLDLEYSTMCLIQNNIIIRLHASVMAEWGSAGNVIAYNFDTGAFDSSYQNDAAGGGNTHGAHPQFNLWEGNISPHVLTTDAIHGSASNTTTFRNWWTGSYQACSPANNSGPGQTTPRGSVTCTPTAAPGGWYSTSVNGWYPREEVTEIRAMFDSSNDNFVGDVLGGTLSNSLTLTNIDKCLTQTTTLVYGGQQCGLMIGYWTDTSSNPGLDSTSLNAEEFYHGIVNIDASITWNSGTTQTLPPSFYLSPTTPSWWTTPWGTPPWPAVGPDVTGGSDGYGHEYAIPAELCWQKSPANSDGTIQFNAGNCYSQSQTTGQPPTAPTNLSAVVQ